LAIRSEFAVRHAIRIASLALAALACRDATGPDAPTVRAVVEQTELPAGQKVWVDVTVSNETSRPIEVPGSFVAMLEVRDASGQVVAYGRFEILEAILRPPRRLAPGGAVTDRAPWAGEATGDKRFPTGRVTPGSYELRAVVPYSRQVPVTGPGYELAYSPPLKVVLTPP
jgi:hypothetical protein